MDDKDGSMGHRVRLPARLDAVQRSTWARKEVDTLDFLESRIQPSDNATPDNLTYLLDNYR